MRACESGSIELVDFLMETRGYDVNGDFGIESILCLVLAGTGKNNINMARHLVTKYHADVSDPDLVSNNRWSLDSLKFLLEECKVPIVDKHILFGIFDLNIIRYLIEEHGVDPSIISEYGETLLFGITWYPKAVPVIKYLIEEHKLDVNHKNNEGHTVIHDLSVLSRPYENIVYLIGECKVPCNKQKMLERACFHEKLDLIKYILDDCGFSDVCEMGSVINLAIYIGNIDIMKYLLTKAKPDDIQWELVYRCAKLDFIIRLVEEHELNIKPTQNFFLNDYYLTIKYKLNNLKSAITSPDFDEMKNATDSINVNYVIDGYSVLVHLLLETQATDVDEYIERNFKYFLLKNPNLAWQDRGIDYRQHDWNDIVASFLKENGEV